MTSFLEKYGRYYASIARLGLPILVGQVGMVVVGFIDNIMVGRYSTEALASASFVNGVFNTAIFACIGFSYGLTPLVGALFTQRRELDTGALVKAGLITNTLFSVLVALLMWILYLNIENLGQPDELIPLIKPYYVLYLFGITALSIFQVFAQWSWGITRTAMPMWIILGTNAFNVFGNWLLIYGNWGFPEMGLTGAGYATLVARWGGSFVIAGIFFFAGKNRKYVEGFMNLGAARRFREVLKTSIPVSLQSTLEAGSFSVAAFMVGWLGAIPLASFQILMVLSTLGFSIYYSVGSAISVLVSNAKGTGDKTEMRRVAMGGYHIMLLLVVLCSLLILVLNKHLIGLFTEDVTVITLTLSLIFPLLLYQLGDGTQIAFANALRGTANVMPMLWIAFVSYILLGVPATYLFGFTWGMGLYGIILSFSISLFTAAVLFLYFFLRTTKST